MGYAKRKKELLESLLNEREAGIKELLSGDSILSEEDLADELIEEALAKYRYFYG